MNGAYTYLSRQLRQQMSQRALLSGAGQHTGGFTIVETMIVLVVTSALFLSAALLVAGQQNKVQFSQSVKDIESITRQTISQVEAGYYANTNNFTCSGVGNNLSLVQSGAGKQGSNDGCIFLGRAVQFGVAGTDPQQYVTYTIAGLKDNMGDIVKAKPTAIAPGASTNTQADFPRNASATDTLHGGLRAVSMSYTTGDGVKEAIGAVAFVSSLGTYSGSDLLSGSQQISLVPVVGSGGTNPLSTNSLNVVDAINQKLSTSPQNPAGGVQICFQSGGTAQSALMTIGGDGRSLSVSTKIKGSKDCS